ncbi:MAG TPA: kelch repeat-containing protein, partial [Archangium sp.]|nr:kelch repeat-containing protein [Archangium sp.]
VTLKATAHDPNPGDALTYAWTASAGTLGSASSATTTWTAPEATGPVMLTLTVLDPHGSSATLSLRLTVRGGRGDADIDVSLNTWPQVARIVATPSRVNVGEPTRVVATALDSDGDALAYQWSATGCTGTWTEATTAMASFTPTEVPSNGSCGCQLGVTVADGRGGQAKGTLSICVGPPATPLFAPEVVGTFQSASSVPAGGTVTLRVEAEDPQGSALSFAWSASTGTLGTPVSGATASEVVWTAPTCVSKGGSASLTATVSNALGLSTATSFTVRGLPDCLAPDSWNVIGGLVWKRILHTATLLPSGRVLMVGGVRVDPGMTLTEVYDPELDVSVSTGSRPNDRFQHTTTLLPSGEVLVVGGTSSDSAELYEPVTGTWTQTGVMSASRFWHTATMLPSGKVLVAGGYVSSEPLATAELYDPATGTWSPTGTMTSARTRATATLLPSGKVLVAGGAGFSEALVTAELYDPVTGTWSPTGVMAGSHAYHSATLLPSGKVLVAGGSSADGSSDTTAEVYDPVKGTWSRTVSMTASHSWHTATLLPSGKVLVAGGGSSAAEVYDPATGAWSPTGAMAVAHSSHT